jgi:hypothetical protein
MPKNLARQKIICLYTINYLNPKLANLSVDNIVRHEIFRADEPIQTTRDIVPGNNRNNPKPQRI